MTHDYLTDLELARVLAPRSLLYLGLLGPRKRGERLLADLARHGPALSAEQLSRIRTPAGLDIGAESPEEIALSIAAEITAALSGRSGGPLRERGGPIHG
jgi:xanthine/CO dehydrogenase XdhC/CoxF family maturation factor